MIKAEFTDDMKQILASMKGAHFKSYECAIDSHNHIYCNFRINTDKCSIEIKNENQVFPFFDDKEEMACFSCKITSEPFKPTEITSSTVFSVKEIINSVEILNDVIDVNNGMYQVSFDNALIIRTNSTTYMFAKDVWFSEIITVRKDDNYDQVISKQEIIDSWSNEGDFSVDIHRTVKKL